MPTATLPPWPPEPKPKPDLGRSKAELQSLSQATHTTTAVTGSSSSSARPRRNATSDGNQQQDGQQHELQYHHLFTCTFCWTISSGRPHVCGEVVVRGDECVSLGWCFWHRACYGCLLCGSRIIAKGVRVGELFESDDGELSDNSGIATGTTDKEGRGRCVRVRVEMGTTSTSKVGKVIDTVPLCANCMVEVDMDGLDDMAVVRRSLRRVDRVDADGGLSRYRWETGKRTTATHHHGDGATSEPPDGTGDEEYMYPVSAEQPTTIYVSMLDPIGRSSFRPSPTKPIPYWMGYGHPNLDDGQPYSHRAGDSKNWPSSHPSTTYPPTITTTTSSRRGQPKRPASPAPSIASSTSPAPCETRAPVRRVVINEPLTLPSSSVTRLGVNNLSESTFSTYATPPEYPSPPPSPHGRGTPEAFVHDHSPSASSNARPATPRPMIQVHKPSTTPASSPFYAAQAHHQIRRRQAGNDTGSKQPPVTIHSMRHTRQQMQTHTPTTTHHFSGKTTAPLVTSNEYLERYPGAAAAKAALGRTLSHRETTTNKSGGGNSQILRSQVAKIRKASSSGQLLTSPSLHVVRSATTSSGHSGSRWSGGSPRRRRSSVSAAASTLGFSDVTAAAAAAAAVAAVNRPEGTRNSYSPRGRLPSFAGSVSAAAAATVGVSGATAAVTNGGSGGSKMNDGDSGDNGGGAGGTRRGSVLPGLKRFFGR
ncbi:hypothetical protein B0H66DRAFT_531939 [Apodospora peruviana]|uniref:LIM zinc-binding domain-containing protein n=1 Tax=Apodospora peruviana TaxID=516989 RepID=A0AAE0M7R9_9PEZI|nr:hypothetical protein B0H66DRAFT_531939 [Apodospora peruviana]